MWALFKLQLKTYFKNPAWMMGYIIITLLLSVFAEITIAPYTQSVASVLAISLISIGMMRFAFELMELRKSVIFKRIGSTSITKPQAMFSLFSFSGFTFSLQLAYAFGLVAIFDTTGYASFDWTLINWGGFFYAIIIGLALSLSLGFFFVAISGGIEQLNMYAMIYFFLASFLGGLFFPGLNSDWMTWVGLFIPHTYISNMINDSFLGQNVFDLTGGYQVTKALPAEVTNLVYVNLQLWIPLAGLALSFGAGWKLFKWDKH